MTHCDLLDIDLIAFADGELHGARREYVEVHLRVCSTCRARLDEFYKTTYLLQRATPLTDDPDGRAQTKARIAQEARRTPRPTRRSPLLFAIPALALLVSLVVWSAKPTEAGFSLQELVHRVVPQANTHPDPSTVLSADRLPGQAVAAMTTSAGQASQAAFQVVIPPRLAGDLSLTSFTQVRPELADLRYLGPDHLSLQLLEAPQTVPGTTAAAADQLVVISGTEVIWHVNPLTPTAITSAIWARSGVQFDLNIVAGPGPGLSTDVAHQIIEQVIAAQGSAGT
jgi:hypothetical protein